MLEKRIGSTQSLNPILAPLPKRCFKGFRKCQILKYM